ncbi:heat-labile enterotoxin IIB, A chain [Metarhizium brunneum]
MATKLGVDPTTWGYAGKNTCEKQESSQYCTRPEQGGWHPGPETCDYFKSLEVKLFLGNGISGFDGAGTFDDLVIEFGNSHQTILVHPSKGEESTKPIDLEKAFGLKRVKVEDIKSFKVYSVRDERTNPDSWEIGGISITATCDESSRKVITNKYDDIYDWFNRFGDITGNEPSHFTGSIAVSDWKWQHPDEKTDTIAVMPIGQSNACTKFKSMEAHLELGSGISALTAGTNDELVLDFSNEMFPKHVILLATAPSHGDVIDKTLDLQNEFGSSPVSAQDVRQVMLYSREGKSHWADPWQVATFELRAKCEGSSRSVVVTKWRNIDKWFDRFEGPSALSGDLSLKDWHWA